MLECRDGGTFQRMAGGGTFSRRLPRRSENSTGQPFSGSGPQRRGNLCAARAFLCKRVPRRPGRDGATFPGSQGRGNICHEGSPVAAVARKVAPPLLRIDVATFANVAPSATPFLTGRARDGETFLSGFNVSPSLRLLNVSPLAVLLAFAGMFPRRPGRSPFPRGIQGGATRNVSTSASDPQRSSLPVPPPLNLVLAAATGKHSDGIFFPLLRSTRGGSADFPIRGRHMFPR